MGFTNLPYYAHLISSLGLSDRCVSLDIQPHLALRAIKSGNITRLSLWVLMTS